MLGASIWVAAAFAHDILHARLFVGAAPGGRAARQAEAGALHATAWMVAKPPAYHPGLLVGGASSCRRRVAGSEKTRDLVAPVGVVAALADDIHHAGLLVGGASGRRATRGAVARRLPAPLGMVAVPHDSVDHPGPPVGGTPGRRCAQAAETSLLDNKDNPNVLFQRYETGRKNTREYILQIASFLDNSIYPARLLANGERILNLVLEHSSLDSMKKDPRRWCSDRTGYQPFIRRGSTGG